MTFQEHQIEVQVGEVWKEVLGAVEIHGSLDFFAAGGDSLQALIVAKKLKAMGFNLPNAGLVRLPQFSHFCSALTNPALFELE